MRDHMSIPEALELYRESVLEGMRNLTEYQQKAVLGTVLYYVWAERDLMQVGRAADVLEELSLISPHEHAVILEIAGKALAREPKNRMKEGCESCTTGTES